VTGTINRSQFTNSRPACYSTHGKLNLLAIRSAAKFTQTRGNLERNPQKYLSNTAGGVQASATQPPNPC
jgi:hypothetical protein